MRVEAEGSVPCELMLVGEQPGYEEQQFGRPFVGKAGMELWTAMRRHCKLSRDDWYLTNVLKEPTAKGRDPKPADIGPAIPDLLDEIEQVQPRLIVTAGATATKVLLGECSMHDVHGIPQTVDLGGFETVVLPIYHPSAGLGNKGMLAPFHWDLKRISACLRGDLQPWAPSPLPVECSWLTEAAARRWAGSHEPFLMVDTEGWPDAPWGLTFCPDGIHAYAIKATDKVGLAWFRGYLARKRAVFHNGLHDMPVMAALGVPCREFEDTQVLAYHDLMREGSGALEAEAQNLGTLAFREVNLRLTVDLEDLPGVDFDAHDIPYTDDVMRYACLDVIAGHRLFGVYRQRGLLEYAPYTIDLGQIDLVEQMIRTGLPFDYDGVLSYYMETLDKIEEAAVALQSKAKRMGLRDFNPGSHLQVRELLTRKVGLRIRKRTRGGLASTNEKALADHKDHPLVQQLQTYRELTKIKGTYLEPLLETLQ